MIWYRNTCNVVYKSYFVVIYKYLRNYSIFHIVASSDFDKSVYSVDEGNGVVQVGLVLSDPSSFDITVQVFTTDGSATGNLTSILFGLNL